MCVCVIKTSNLFLFNCEPGRLDHDYLKDGNFEDDGQGEIATRFSTTVSSKRVFLGDSNNDRQQKWPPKPEIHIVETTLAFKF